MCVPSRCTSLSLAVTGMGEHCRHPPGTARASGQGGEDERRLKVIQHAYLGASTGAAASASAAAARLVDH
jgi:hypothetical protein